MDITFSYNKKEWVDARRKYLILSKTITIFQVISMLIFACAIGVLIALRGISILAIAAIGVAVVYCLVLILLYYWQPGYLFTNTDQLHLEQKLHISDSGITATYANGSSSTVWKDYLSYAKSDNYYYLIKSKQSYVMIPKRVFNEDDLITFDGILKSNLQCAQRQ